MHNCDVMWFNYLWLLVGYFPILQSPKKMIKVQITETREGSDSQLRNYWPCCRKWKNLMDWVLGFYFTRHQIKTIEKKRNGVWVFTSIAQQPDDSFHVLSNMSRFIYFIFRRFLTNSFIRNENFTNNPMKKLKTKIVNVKNERKKSLIFTTFIIISSYQNYKLNTKI